MPRKNSVLLEKQICPESDSYYEDDEEEIIPKPKTKKQILPKTDNNDQEELIRQLVEQMAEKKLKEREIKPKGKRGPKLPLSEKHI